MRDIGSLRKVAREFGYSNAQIKRMPISHLRHLVKHRAKKLADALVEALRLGPYILPDKAFVMKVAAGAAKRVLYETVLPSREKDPYLMFEVRTVLAQPKPKVEEEPEGPQLGWHEQRVLWNKDGQCSRAACRAPLTTPRLRHTGTGLAYCRDCAILINSTNRQALVRGEVEEPHALLQGSTGQAPDTGAEGSRSEERGEG